uniref:Uncharacterized protein n=1 Tax=Ciona intestinalis TaxID=7719 RepID=H2Y1H6_CIOIN
LTTLNSAVGNDKGNDIGLFSFIPFHGFELFEELSESDSTSEERLLITCSVEY